MWDLFIYIFAKFIVLTSVLILKIYILLEKLYFLVLYKIINRNWVKFTQCFFKRFLKLNEEYKFEAQKWQ